MSCCQGEVLLTWLSGVGLLYSLVFLLPVAPEFVQIPGVSCLHGDTLCTSASELAGLVLGIFEGGFDCAPGIGSRSRHV